MRKSIFSKLGKDAVANIVCNSNTMSDVLVTVGLTPKGTGNFNTLKQFCAEHDIDISHLRTQAAALRARALRKSASSKKIPLSDILVKDSSYNRGHLKDRLLASGLLTNICYECSQGTEWNGQQLVLQLDHINGDSTDNRIDNLRMLCPNCHSQTKTFSK